MAHDAIRVRTMSLRKIPPMPALGRVSRQDAVAAGLGEWIVLLAHAAGSPRRAARQAIADRGPLLVARHVLHEDLLAPGLVERTQVRIKIVRVGVGAPSRVDPRDRR